MTAQSVYQFGAGHVGAVDHPATTMFLSLASLLCLESFTIRADLDFIYHSGLPGMSEFRSSIPSIACLLKTAPRLQHLTLDFHCRLNSHLYIPYDSESLWSPLVSLISESSSPCIKLRVKASKRPLPETISPKFVTSSLASCPTLTQMVEQGVLVIIPVMPDPPVPEAQVEEPSDQDKPTVMSPTSSRNINDSKERTSYKWLSNLWLFSKFVQR